MSNISKMCGEGSHYPACTGTGLHHFDDPDADNGIPFRCACGCHYVPVDLGQVYPEGFDETVPEPPPLGDEAPDEQDGSPEAQPVPPEDSSEEDSSDKGKA
jgi:hypothetical protein